MSVESMTGFATATADTGAGRFQLDIRSVNGRSLDVKLRLPNGFEAAETAMRRRIGERIARGNVQATLSLQGATERSGVRIDGDLFRALAAKVHDLAAEAGLPAPTSDAILAIRGVITTDDAPVPVDEALVARLADLTDQALDGLVASRRAEGASLAGILAGHLDAIESLVAAALADPASQPEAIRARLAGQLDRLLAATDKDSLDPGRLNAEAALLATKADVREETDRLTAHVAAARTLLSEGGAIGRKLDFLSQEFNREANTLCSKSASAGLTAIGLDLKSAIDQLREQVQNIQ